MRQEATGRDTSRRQHPHTAAFADGRRLRNERRMRDARRMQPPGGPRPRASRRRAASPALIALVVLMIMMVTGATVVSSVVVVAFGVLLASMIPVLVGLGVVFLVTAPDRRRQRRELLHHQMRRHPMHTAPYPPPVPPRPDRLWAGTRAQFHALRARYAAFECDALAVLRLPALSDVSVPSTARFVDAFAEAQALDTDQYPPERHARAFAQAVDRAERAWQAAVDAAERIRLSGLDANERRMIERVVKLLTTARESDSGPERLAAYTLARAELAKLDKAGVVHVPLRATLELDAATRGELTA